MIILHTAVSYKLDMDTYASIISYLELERINKIHKEVLKVGHI